MGLKKEGCRAVGLAVLVWILVFIILQTLKTEGFNALLLTLIGFSFWGLVWSAAYSRQAFQERQRWRQWFYWILVCTNGIILVFYILLNLASLHYHWGQYAVLVLYTFVWWLVYPWLYRRILSTRLLLTLLLAPPLALLTITAYLTGDLRFSLIYSLFSFLGILLFIRSGRRRSDQDVS